MKNKLTAVLLATLIPLVAFAAGHVRTYSYTSSAAAAAPNTSSVGVLLEGPNGEPATAVQVSIVDYSDGGSDDEYGAIIAANAWVYNVEDKKPDGGGYWSRAPVLDVSTTFSGGDVTLGSITASRGATVMIPSSAVAGQLSLGGAGTKLYYQPDSFTNIDGGSAPAVVRTTIKVRY